MFRTIALIFALFFVTSSVALGAKPTSSSSINLVGSTPSYGQTVTFNVSTNVTTAPFVHLKCFQGSTLVLQGWMSSIEAAYYGSYFFTLASDAWKGGAANCTAYLENFDRYGFTGKIKVLASTSFNVNAVSGSSFARTSSSVIAPHTETYQHAYFYGMVPNSQYVVLFSAYHYEGDPFPYTLGSNAYSSSNGIAKAIVGVDDLASFYNGGAGPIYEVKACISAVGDPLGLAPIACTADTYVGYYPESMWYYNG